MGRRYVSMSRPEYGPGIGLISAVSGVVHGTENHDPDWSTFTLEQMHSNFDKTWVWKASVDVND